MTEPESTFVGIDILQREQFARLRGKRIGLITNATGRNQDGQATADLLHTAPDVKLTALFGPEHGIRGLMDERVPDSVDEATGLPVFSLYGERNRPLPEQLAGLDLLVYDIQDIGTRFYTYISTLGLCMEEADRVGLSFLVLDRPNPIGGVAVEGPVADADSPSFVAHHPIPIRHGLTVGEMARLLAMEKGLRLPVDVVPVENWRRGDLWDATGLIWVHPSPNMRSLTQALLYPGAGLWEFTNLSVGRGTDTPFELIGAPWLQGNAAREWARALNAMGLPGIRFLPVEFTPRENKYAGELCGGINLHITCRREFTPVLTGFALAETLLRLFSQAWDTTRINTLLANAQAQEALLSGVKAEELMASCAPDVEAFRSRCRPHLLYA